MVGSSFFSLYILHLRFSFKMSNLQHKQACINDKNFRALVDHCLDYGHSFHFDEASILAYESNCKNPLFLEIYYINKNYNFINFRIDIDNLGNFGQHYIQLHLSILNLIVPYVCLSYLISYFSLFSLFNTVTTTVIQLLLQ